MSNAIKFRLLASGKVQQTLRPDDTTLIDPDLSMQRFEHRSGEQVRAAQIPKPFIVGADLCTDGYLVLSKRGLYAISSPTFRKDYEPVLSLDAA